MIKINNDSVITYQNGLGELQGGLYADNCYYPYRQWGDYYHQHFYYPQYPVYINNEPNKVETAFKVVAKLLEEKIIEGLTAKKLIELVKKIAETI